MNQEKWNEICFHLSENIKSNINEKEFEQNVIQALRVLEWKEYLGDFKIRPTLRIGANRSVEPDFIIKSSNDKNLFVIEIKPPSIQFNEKFQQQLFSYMRLSRLQYGLLIGETIQLFYDGDLTDNDDPVLLETFEIRNTNSKGIKFVEIFSKDSFHYDSLKTFTLNSLKRINRKSEQKKLERKIISEEFESEVLELIKQNLLKQYDGELIDNLLQNISIDISLKYPDVVVEQINIKNNSSEKNYTRDTTKYKINGSSEKLGKNRFVLQIVKEYLERKPSSYKKLKQIFKDEFQGSIGIINQLEEVENKYANRTNKRHFVEDNEVLKSSDGINIVVSTEWGIGNIKNIVQLARELGFQVEEYK